MLYNVTEPCFELKPPTNLTAQNYQLFPVALGQLLKKHHVKELHLTLNAGSWNYESWGMPKDDQTASGATLWVWIDSAGTEAR